MPLLQAGLPNCRRACASSSHSVQPLLLALLRATRAVGAKAHQRTLQNCVKSRRPLLPRSPSPRSTRLGAFERIFMTRTSGFHFGVPGRSSITQVLDPLSRVRLCTGLEELRAPDSPFNKLLIRNDAARCLFAVYAGRQSCGRRSATVVGEAAFPRIPQASFQAGEYTMNRLHPARSDDRHHRGAYAILLCALAVAIAPGSPSARSRLGCARLEHRPAGPAGCADQSTRLSRAARSHGFQIYRRAVVRTGQQSAGRSLNR